MKKNFRIIALLLAMVMLFSFAACSKQNKNNGTNNQGSTPTTAPTTAPTNEPSSGTGNSQTDISLEGKNITYFSLSWGKNYEDINSLIAYPNEDGTLRVEYDGEEKRVGDLDASAVKTIIEALGKSGLVQLNGKEVYGDGEANASMYIAFDNEEDFLSANFGGDIPQEYIKGYESMDACFKELVKELPLYVPTPQVMGEVDEDLLNSSLEILNNTGIDTLDTFAIMEYPKDEYFAASVGLSSADGIDKAVSSSPMMMTTAYSMVIVELEDGKKISDVRGDFEKNLDWRKWVCVAPSNAMIAQKGNMVMCLMGSADLFTKTVEAAEAAGWTDVKHFDNPDM